MVYISIQDFLNKAESISRMEKDEEIECARLMKNGDKNARERLIENYLPVIASHIKHTKPNLQTLGLVVYYQEALEKAIDSFDFFQENKTFVHHLSRYLRQAKIKYIVR